MNSHQRRIKRRIRERIEAMYARTNALFKEVYGPLVLEMLELDPGDWTKVTLCR